MENIVMILGLIATGLALAIQGALYCSRNCCHSWELMYKETALAGIVLMVIAWIFRVQSGTYLEVVNWMNKIAVGYTGMFFVGVISTFMLDKKRSSQQQVICADMKKSAMVYAIIYFVMAYLMG